MSYWYDIDFFLSDERYVISPGYLEIPNINRTDDGIYKCTVIGVGNFMVVPITVTVTGKWCNWELKGIVLEVKGASYRKGSGWGLLYRE